jgi:hypothetical protein
LAYSVEKLSDHDRRTNFADLESLKFPRAEGTATLGDLRAQIRSVRHASRFPQIFGHISIQLKIASILKRSFSTESAGSRPRKARKVRSGWP